MNSLLDVMAIQKCNVDGVKCGKAKALQKRNVITRLQSECNEIKEQVTCVKKSVQNLVDNLMRVIEGQK